MQYQGAKINKILLARKLYPIFLFLTRNYIVFHLFVLPEFKYNGFLHKKIKKLRFSCLFVCIFAVNKQKFCSDGKTLKYGIV